VNVEGSAAQRRVRTEARRQFPSGDAGSSGMV